jgi:hypothetical protein
LVGAGGVKKGHDDESGLSGRYNWMHESGGLMAQLNGK